MNCDRIARWYRWLEYASFGRALERRRFAYLNKIAGARRALVLGDGDGRFLAALRNAAPACEIDYIDLSGTMLELARERAGRERIRYRQADALTIPLPEAEYDLIATHFFLDCLDERGLRLLLDKAARAAAPGARWMVSEFRDTSPAFRALVRTLYWFFRCATGLRVAHLVRHRPAFQRAGFRLSHEEFGWRGLLVSELWTYGGAN
jgi:ubiquinone/menaquinone biosynthesis C-methylase UbiE